MKELNMYEKWYKNLENEKDFRINILSENDILELQNFFLVCQKAYKRKIGGFKLYITCKDEKDAFRIQDYLSLAKFHPSVDVININGFNIKDNKISQKEKIGGKIKSYYKRVPLILINKEMYYFLSARLDTIAQEYQVDSLLSTEMINIINNFRNVEDARKILLKIFVNNLLGEVGQGTKRYSAFRREYFLKNNFYQKIKDMPFLACLIFSFSIRTQNRDAIEAKKEKVRKEKKIKKVVIKEEWFEELFLDESELESEVFNAWDISDGLLQLLENIILHAGENGKKDGEGVFTMRISKNDIVPSNNEENEFNEDSVLFQNYQQYFRGYTNEYRNRNVDEVEQLKKAQTELLNGLKEGYYVESKLIYDYEKIRKQIEKRRKERQKNTYFLDIQIADFSGKNMCDVFRENLKKRNDPNKDRFNDITVRSFFDPSLDEINLWDDYYKGDNAIQHFGLQIFLSIISDNEGCFTVRSYKENCAEKQYYSNTGAKLSFNKTLPGTAYDILIPMKSCMESERANNTFLNTDINYKFTKLDELLPGEVGRRVIVNFWKLLKEADLSIVTKESLIRSLADILRNLPKENRVIIFDCNEIEETNQFEIFVKTLIYFIAQEENRNCINNIAVINCSTNIFVEFIRYFLIYYDKNGNCEWMTHKQIYLCGKDSVEEFIVSGKNMQIMLGRMEKLAFSRRLNPNCLSMLTRMLHKRLGKENEEEEEEFKYTPFDLIIRDGKGRTIFEQNVLKVLDENIQKLESGCKIEPTHMRIGSKIHMNAFYEAELLFFNNYYVNRFAYLLTEMINRLGIDLTRPIWLVGYEAYSEMLICRLRDYVLENYNIDVQYSIYENSRGSSSNIEENLRYFDVKKTQKLLENEAQVLLVVPINSTLTTFNKLENILKKRVGKRFHVDAYLGIIQVRDAAVDGMTDMEDKYWDSVDIVDKKITSKYLLSSGNHVMSYLIMTSARWEDPQKCSACYPTDCLMETPLIETDRTSVVPTQLIGLKEKVKFEDIRNFEYNSFGRIDSLDNYFYFDHIERGKNHYQTYIRTANYYMDHKEYVEEWLKLVKEKINERKEKKVLSFDVLVNPLHFSNAAFVEAVNEVVFNGASYTVRVEVEKEFRDNVETKFSDLKLLYKKLVNMKIPAEINIHFVDDSINLGGNYMRMKHIMSSLFPQKAVEGSENVKVNIFKSVIVLVNRLSVSSIRDYVSDVNNYFYYLDLRISSMRTHEDACYLCKEKANAQKISESCATNNLSTYWKEQNEKYRMKSLLEAKRYKKEKGKKYYERYFKRIKCTHNLNTELVKMGENINDSLMVLQQTCNLILMVNKNEFVEYLMGYLYAYATPFVSYRKSAREGAFILIIILLEYLIEGDDATTLLERVQTYETVEQDEWAKEYKEWAKECVNIVARVLIKLDEINMDKTERYCLLKLLMKLSAELKSNYILREDRIAQIVNFAKEVGDDKDRFIIYYTALMKKILILNADESKSAKADLTLRQYASSIIESCENREFITELLIAMYLENTVGLRGVVNNLNNLDQTNNFLPLYNDSHYKYILEVNGVKSMVFLNEFKALYDLFTKNDAQTEQSELKNIPFYEKLCKNFTQLLDMENAWCAVKLSEQVLVINEVNEVVYRERPSFKVFGRYIQSQATDVKFETIMDGIEKKNFLLDTLFYDVTNASAVVRYPISLGEKQEEVFFVFNFKKQNISENIQKIKFLLLFRSEIMSKLLSDFNNNILQEWMEKNKILEQLRKARANSHTDENNMFDMNSVWTLSEGFLFGDKESIIEHKEKYGNKMLGCLLGLMMNIRIGRSNVLLLSKGEFSREVIRGKLKFEYLREEVEVLKQIYFYDTLKIVDENKKELRNAVFPEYIYDAWMEKGRDGAYFDFKNYLLYFIFELFHSAVVNGRKEDGRVEVIVYKDGVYLFFENKVKSTFSCENIERGLRREGEGISLATICEYFIYNYENRNVKVIIENDMFSIGLPIFAEEGEYKDGYFEDIHN